MILGLSINADQTTACLLRNGKVVYAAAEERLTRIKRDRNFPSRAITQCLKEAGVGLEGFEAVAVSWNPATNMRHINMSGFTFWRRYDPEWLYIAPNNLIAHFAPDAIPEQALRMELGVGGECPIYFVDHHLSHAAHAVFQSPFTQGAFAVVDEYGEVDSVTMGHFGDKGIEVLRRIPYPHSLGVFFAALTEHLGYAPNADEWKIMGAAAYGNPTFFRDKVAHLLEWDEESSEWFLNQRYIDFANMKRGGYSSRHLETFLGIKRREPGAELTQAHFDLAAAAQDVFEERMFQLLSSLAAMTGETNLCAAGGCFMNSLANGRITSRTPFKDVFIPYSAADNGGAVGAALWVEHAVQGVPRSIEATPPSPFLGPSYPAREIPALLSKYGLRGRVVDDPSREAARLVSEGALLGWFSGAMEIGERALGARSILADPRRSDMKDKINASVKYREFYRPFAASVLKEEAPLLFEVPEGIDIPYMERVVRVRSEMVQLIPAVVHKDGTCRIQTVTSETHSAYHAMISEFKHLTGLGMVLNTSFNLNGEPIVCSPEDAIRTFFTSGMEALFLENVLILK